MSSLIYKSVDETPLTAVGGEGVWIHTECGRRILDTCGGVVVSALGHRHPRMIAAIERAAPQLHWAHAGSFTTPAAEELAEFLTARGGGLAKCNFLSGGSEVMELALKVALQVQHERGFEDRTLFVSRHQSYHGSTLGMLGLSGNPARRFPFEKVLPETTFVSACNAYRGKADGESDDQYVTRLAQELDDTFTSIGPTRVAAFMAEPVVGSSAGAVPFVKGYLAAMQTVCRRHGVLFLVDDVMCGMGRTGFLFSHLEDDMTPDILAMGKGLAAGYQPVSGLMLHPDVHESIARGSGILRNGQTHVNHPFACAIALEVQKTIEDDGLLDQVRASGAELQALLRAALGAHSNVGDIRGKGLMIGVELVEDRAAKSPLPDTDALTRRIKAEGLARDMLLYPGSGTIDGRCGNHVMFAPPFVSTSTDLAEMVDRFVRTLDAAL